MGLRKAIKDIAYLKYCSYICITFKIMETTSFNEIQCNVITKNNTPILEAYQSSIAFSQYQSPTIIKLLTWHP